MEMALICILSVFTASARYFTFASMPRIRFRSNFASGSRVSPLAAFSSAAFASAVRVAADLGFAPWRFSVLPAFASGALVRAFGPLDAVCAACAVAARAFAVEATGFAARACCWLRKMERLWRASPRWARDP